MIIFIGVHGSASITGWPRMMVPETDWQQYEMLFHEDLIGIKFEGDAYVAVRTAEEVVSFVFRMCADAAPTVEEMVEEMMRGVEIEP